MWRESWLLCLICLSGVWWWLCGSSSRCHRVVCGLWLWYFLIILTYYFLSLPVKYFTDRSKAALLLWIFYVFSLSCVCMLLWASVYMCLVVTCWERTDLLALVCGVQLWVCHFPIGILGQVWYLIVSILDLCTLTYFEFYYIYNLVKNKFLLLKSSALEHTLAKQISWEIYTK